MGQYHLVLNLDKKEYLHPHRFDSGLKAWEIAANSTQVPRAMVLLMAHGGYRGGGDFNNQVAGRWHGDRVVIVGDYAEDDDFVSRFKVSNLYHNASENWLELSEIVLPVLAEEFDMVGENMNSRGSSNFGV